MRLKLSNKLSQTHKMKIVLHHVLLSRKQSEMLGLVGRLVYLRLPARQKRKELR